MRRFLLWTTAAAAALVLPAAAMAAQPAFTTTDVNLRAGPGTDYPVVDTIPGGARLRIQGCIAGYNWCSVAWRGEYGWAQGDYLAALYRGNRVVVIDEGPEIGLPIIGFDIGTYWGRHYRHRGFYARIHNYEHGRTAIRAGSVNGRSANVRVNGRNANVGVNGRNAAIAPAARQDHGRRHAGSSFAAPNSAPHAAAVHNGRPQFGHADRRIGSAPPAHFNSAPFRGRETTGAAPAGNAAPRAAAPVHAAPAAPARPAPAAAPAGGGGHGGGGHGGGPDHRH